MEKRILKVGLCAGRHEIPAVSSYIFGEIQNPLDFEGMEKHVSSWLKEVGYFDELHLYVTGLTSSLISVLNVVRNCEVVLYHYDRETGDYVPQKFFLTGQHARLSMETWGM